MIETDALIKILAKPAIKEAMPIFKKIKDKVSHVFNDGLLDYFSASLDRHKEIKTLLHRQPTPFYKVYYPAKLYDSSNGTTLKTESVKEIFKSSNFVTIIGDAGSGKSTLLKHLFISTFVEYYNAPIFVNLRDLDLNNSNLDVYIIDNIINNKLAPSEAFLENLLKKGEFLFFLDGYDEINSTDKHAITKNLERFIDKYPKNKFILTSRPYSNIEFFKNFRNLEIKNLDKDDQVSFIQQQIVNTRLSSKIVESLKEATQGNIQSFFKNPLLLTLYIMAYSKNSSIPNKKYVFYRRVFDVLFAEHDSATKIGYEREIRTQLNQESLEDVLQTFCFLSFFESEFDFKKDYIFKLLNIIKDKTSFKFRNNDFIEDMKLSVGLWSEDCGVYGFSHRSMQEYFAAVYLANMNSIENKKKVYNKILNFVSERAFDSTNFLSLCYEMDKSFFIESYSIPIINRIRDTIIKENGEINLDFSYIESGFHVTKRMHSNGRDIRNQISYNISKDLFLLVGVSITPDFTISYLDRITSKIIDCIDSPNFNKYFPTSPVAKAKKDKKDKKVNNEPSRFKLAKNIDYDEFYAFLYDHDVIPELIKISKELDEITTKMELILSKDKVTEDDFVTMI